MLTSLIFLPAILALIVLVLPNEKLVRWVSLVGSAGVFVASLVLLGTYDPSTAAIQLAERYEWIPSVGISYFVGLDGISIWLVLLTTFLTPLVVLGSWTGITKQISGFHAALLFLETTMIGTFLALDAVVFYVFFEAALIPMYFMIGIWGGPRRIYATVKFFIYTMLGSLFMLVSIIAMMFMVAEQMPEVGLSADLLHFYQLKIPFVGGEFFSTQTLLFFGFALAFAIKIGRASCRERV